MFGVFGRFGQIWKSTASAFSGRPYGEGGKKDPKLTSAHACDVEIEPIGRFKTSHFRSCKIFFTINGLVDRKCYELLGWRKLSWQQRD
jgi:hypothetical protein